MNNNRLKKVVSFFLLSLCNIVGYAQFTYGTTGLLNMPTADMQESGTFMAGTSFLNKHTSTSRWFYNTFNYYFNITLFPFFELSYNMGLHKAFLDDYGMQKKGYWVSKSVGRFVNQDRQFCVRLRLWKEGWFYDWTPQVVIGSDDITSHSWGNTKRQFAIEHLAANGFNNRYYLAATKHFCLKGLGELGAHLAYLYNVRRDYSLNALSLGTNLKIKVDDCYIWGKYVNGLNIMLEAYPGNGQGYIYDNSYEKTYNLGRGIHLGKYDVNMGAKYDLPLTEKKTNNNAPVGELSVMAELYGCRHFSAGIQYKLHLK